MRVLIVEDYAPLRGSLAKGLREAGYAVDVAADGEVGLWHAIGEDYDTIVLDLMLPKLDGLTVLERIRQAGKEAPVLILTARDAVKDRVRGLEAGADDYLVKPFAFEELLARVKALTRRRYAVKSPTVRIGDLEIDRASQRVKRGERAIEVTAKQYAFLELLALRAGQVVSRAEIWSHLYEFEAEPNSNLLEVYVGQLRRKLEAAGESRLIHTRRGAGYVLEEIA